MAFLIVGVLICLLIWREYDAKKQREQFSAERETWITERRELNTRIQAPERVPLLTNSEPRPKARVIDPDDDAAFKKLIETN